MITGVVAQELAPLPRGVFKPVRLFSDNEVLFLPTITSGLDQRLFPGRWLDAEESFFDVDMPQTLTSDAVLESWQDGELLFKPVIARDLQFLPGFYTSPDLIFTPDIRVPGYLMPARVTDIEAIFPTPLILDPGMWRQEETYYDPDFVPSPLVYAAQTFFPPRLDSLDLIYVPRIIAGSLSPPLLLSDDIIYPFASQIRLRPPLFVDTGRPALPPTTWDGVNDGVTISSDGLTASLTAPRNYCGARSKLTKTGGKYYWEIKVGPSHGQQDQAGILRADGNYVNMAQATVSNFSLGVFLNYQVIDDGPAGNPQGQSVAGTVIGNGLWYCHFGHSRGANNGFLVEGDIIGIAVDLGNRVAWFRLNGGPWNNNQLGLSVVLNQSPATGVGGIPLPNFAMGPAVVLGGPGNAGDNLTGNFGLKAYSAPAPDGYADWAIDSPLGNAINGDSFGGGLIGIPASLNNGAEFVTMSNGNLTATHSTTNDSSGVMSASSQRSGRYYFEYTIGATHGRSDSVGLMVTSLSGPNPEGTFARFASGSASANVFMIDGAIWSNAANTGKNIGVILAGDVVGIAIDLTTQTLTQGGNIWFRKKSGGVVSNWNGADLPGDADPALGIGGLPVYGFTYSKTWAPAVGFSGSFTAIGDNVTANFGATPHAMARPNGYSVWPTAYNNSVQVLLANTVPLDDAIIVGAIDTQDRLLFHPFTPVGDDVIYATRSVGGTLMFMPGLVFDTDAAYPPGFFPRFDFADPQITLSPDHLTATVATAVSYTGARSTAQQIAGKFYFEVAWTGAHSSQDQVGILQENTTLFAMGSGFAGYTALIGNGGIVISNDGFTGKQTGAPVSGDIVCVAIDLDFRKGWFRINGGLWNGDVTADPAINIGGVPIKALVSFAPAVTFNSPVGNAYTLNFGVSSLAFAPPLGFTHWPGNTVTKPPLLPALLTDDDTFAVPKIDPQTLGPSLLAADDIIPLLSGSGGSLTVGPNTVVADPDTILSPQASFPLATLDGPPANVTLSNGNRTATHSNTSGDSGARSTAWKTSGKWYFEATMTNTHGSFDCVGVLLSTGTFANFVSASINCVSTFKSSGNIWSGDAYSGKTLGACTSGDIISVAVDMTARKAWLRKNGGNWNGLALGSENPNTGLGGVTIAAGGFAPAVGFGGAGTAINDAMAVNFGQSALAFAAPASFALWTSKPDIPYTLAPVLIADTDNIFPAKHPLTTYATFDGVAVNVTLSNGNKTATHNSTATNSGARSTMSKVGGKFYFEVTVGQTTGAQDTAGILASTGTYTDMVNSSNSFGIRLSTGQMFGGGLNQGNALGPIVAGDVLGFAVYFEGQAGYGHGWVCKNGGFWNGSSAANPATDAGAAIFYVAGPPPSVNYEPAVVFGGAGTAINDNMTANFGASGVYANANASPAGFGDWGV